MPITYLDVPKGIRSEEKANWRKPSTLRYIRPTRIRTMSVPDDEKRLHGLPVIATGRSRGLAARFSWHCWRTVLA
jgi:hypothetical protein